jgi:ABC-type glycerol-3-phosphate transport system permease component
MRPIARALSVAIVAGLAAVFAYPFVWMLFATFKTNTEIFRPWPLLPERFTADAYRALLDGSLIPFPRQLANSLAVALAQAALAVGVSAPAGFAFATYRFRGRRALLATGLLTVALPVQVLVLPLFSWFHGLGLHDTLTAMILPGVASGLGLAFFTLVFARLPRELVEVARAEGASEARVFLTLLALVRPAALAFAFIQFLLAFQEHLVPLVMAGAEANKTAPLALASLYGSTVRFPYALLMAGCLLMGLPAVLLFLALRRHFRSALRDLIPS